MKHAREGGFLIARIHQLSGRILARKLKEQGIEELNPAQGRIMFALWRTDGISISELARQTSLGPSTLTSMLDRLESSGLLRRAPAPGDRRKILVWRAAKDRALQATYARISKEMTELFYRGLTQTEVDRFEGDLRRILRNLSGR
jgi:MarR family transcriptional regulator, organic hydroperoxide resistance regulator